MTDRRQYPRWTVERRQLPPAPRPSWWWPVIVIPWIFYVAAGGSLLSTEASLLNSGEASGGHSVAAPFNVTAQPPVVTAERHGVESPCSECGAVTPQTAAFPDRTCFYGRYPLEYFCFVLTQKRG